MKPELDLLKQRIEKDPNRDIETSQRHQKQVKAIFAKYGYSPLGGFVLPLAQAPVFMSMFFALQRLPELYPQTLSMEGILWFPNLAVPDPYYILPLLTAGSFALTIEISKKSMEAADPALAKNMVAGMRVLAAIMVPFTATFPSVMFVYWLPNNLVSLFSSLLTQQASVRKKFGIWDPPKPPPGSTGPSKGLWQQILEVFGEKQKEMERQRQQVTFMHKPPSGNNKTDTSTVDMAKVARHNQQLRLAKIRRGASKQSKNK
jgi:YidC/Oxa1 family membrane protein insertase